MRGYQCSSKCKLAHVASGFGYEMATGNRIGDLAKVVLVAYAVFAASLSFPSSRSHSQELSELPVDFLLKDAEAEALRN